MDAFANFLRQYRTRHFSKGELILVQGEVPEAAFVIKKGVIKTYNLTADGEEKPISYDIRGEVFPTGWIFSKIKWAQYYYEAFTDCELYVVPRQAYREFLQSNPKIMFEALQSLVGFYINHQMRINALEQSKATAKVINTIHFLCLRFGTKTKSGAVQIMLPLTQQELANFMGLTRETTGIELKKLQRQGILTYSRQKYLVNVDKLNEHLDEDYDQGFVQSEPDSSSLDAASSE